MARIAKRTLTRRDEARKLLAQYTAQDYHMQRTSMLTDSYYACVSAGVLTVLYALATIAHNWL